MKAGILIMVVVAAIALIAGGIYACQLHSTTPDNTTDQAPTDSTVADWGKGCGVLGVVILLGVAIVLFLDRSSKSG